MQLTRTFFGPHSPARLRREREVGRLGDAVGADHRRAAQAADRGDDDDRAAAALRHLRDREHVAEPEVALDVRAHDLVEGFVGDVERAGRNTG